MGRAAAGRRQHLDRQGGSGVSATSLDEAKKYTSAPTAAITPRRSAEGEGLHQDRRRQRFLGDASQAAGGRIDIMPISGTLFRKMKADQPLVKHGALLSSQSLGIACEKKLPGRSSRQDAGSARQTDRRRHAEDDLR
jgi:polar amino acid transport system substrate-binding protein